MQRPGREELNAGSGCPCAGKVCHTRDIRAASRQEEEARNPDCGRGSDADEGVASAGNTDHIDRIDTASDPCESTCVTPNGAGR